MAPLLRAARLVDLSIRSHAAPPDLELIGELVSLRSLFLYPGSVSSVFHLKGAAMFSRLKNLEVLRCFAFIDDQDLTPLARLSKLTYLCFYGTFSEGSVGWLQGQLPGCKVDLTVGEPPKPPPEEQIGVLAATQLEDGSWSVFQDLTELLGHPTNHDVQDAVEREPRRIAPAVLERIELDSEPRRSASTPRRTTTCRRSLACSSRWPGDARATTAATERTVQAVQAISPSGAVGGMLVDGDRAARASPADVG